MQLIGVISVKTIIITRKLNKLTFYDYIKLIALGDFTENLSKDFFTKWILRRM